MASPCRSEGLEGFWATGGFWGAWGDAVLLSHEEEHSQNAHGAPLQHHSTTLVFTTAAHSPSPCIPHRASNHGRAFTSFLSVSPVLLQEMAT